MPSDQERLDWLDQHLIRGKVYKTDVPMTTCEGFSVIICGRNQRDDSALHGYCTVYEWNVGYVEHGISIIPLIGRGDSIRGAIDQAMDNLQEESIPDGSIEE